LLTDSHSIFKSWRNYFCHLLNVRGFKAVQQSKILTDEILVTEHSYFKVEIAFENLKRYIPLSTDQILTELSQNLGLEIPVFINYFENKKMSSTVERFYFPYLEDG
jgi:hypothetical protein